MSLLSHRGRPPRPAPEACPHLPLTDRLTDLLIDMQFRHDKPHPAHFARLHALSHELHQRVARGELTTVRRRSRIWDAPGKRASWYGRNQATDPLPDHTPKTYRLGGRRIQ